MKREIEMNFSFTDKKSKEPGSFTLLSFKEKANVLLASRASELCPAKPTFAIP